MCFVARCAYAFVFKVLVFKVLEHVATLYFGVSSELQRCKRPCAVKMYALALKRVVTLKVHLFHEEQKDRNAWTMRNTVSTCINDLELDHTWCWRY